MAPPGPVDPYSSTGVSTFQAFSSQLGSAAPRYESVSERQRQDHHEGGDFYWGVPDPSQDHGCSSGTHPEDEDTTQREQGKSWLACFLQSRGTTTRSPQSQQQQPNPISVSVFREALYGSAQLVAQLEEFCHSLKDNMHDDSVWEDSYLRALHVKEELQEKLKLLSDAQCLQQLKVKVSRAAQKRARRLRARKELQMERKRAKERCAEKEAAIDKWRMRQIQQVEEKKKARTPLFECAT